ncbi:winged helix-turn-helix domain-containing protein [Natrinema versiforme]|uniref:ArsR family transcriptional regulator n=1 Tax=Natrinema versiforme JCM 10478 TaxID=1227496 RepID=L9YBC9_9EURY|nr:winged helix-turn-helix domain-containing protein [Natrinema versiforme]ELY71002.1 hypothetical protein C489_01551 [Natrinema versiforme JCM 10478]
MTPDDESETAVRDAFSLFDHEIRLEILLALLEDWRAVYTEPRSYAELMDAVGMRDSGKFNYHLDKLRGVYVREVEDGYVPTAAVTALYRAVLAHRPTDRLALDRTTIDSTCPRCEGAAVLRYERGFVTVECSACEEWPGFTYPFPKNGIEGRDPDAVVRATARRARYHAGLARTGQCPFCAGQTAVDVHLESDADGWGDEDGESEDVVVEIACETCTFLVGMGPLPPLLFDGRVAGAFADIGVDLERADWELPAPTARVDARDPLRLALSVAGDAGTATIVVDDSLTVRSVDIER